MKLKEVLDKTIAFFKEKKFDTPRLDAELLLAHGLGIERIQLYLKFDQPLKEEELQKCRDMVKRRTQGEPVAYILGYKEFYGFKFAVDKNVLIPRPETEHIVEEVITWYESEKEENAPLRILDLGCGSGCIGLSLLKKIPSAELTAVDVSEAALAIAKANSESLSLSARSQFLLGDAELVFKQIKDEFDVIVANPPYIASDDSEVEVNVKKYEPEQALFAKNQGLYFLKKWSELYRDKMSEKSVMLMEMGYQQGPEMTKHFESLQAFEQVRIIKDLSGHNRIIYGAKNG